MKNKYFKKITPIFIIGAPRSGTNILRDTISSFNQVGTWDCDEIPYIWRYGNKKKQTDILTPEMITPDIKKYIKNQFIKISNDTKKKYIVEKTCANSLRLDFVDTVIPKAKFIYIIRNGYDAVSSIINRWDSSFSLLYTYKKFKYVPTFDIPFYGIQFFKNRLFKSIFNDRLKFWGPKFIPESQINDAPIQEIAAHQWNMCVKSATNSFKTIDKKNVFNIKYEDFVTEPENLIDSLSNFLELPQQNRNNFPVIRTSSLKKGVNKLSNYELEIITPIIKKTMLDNNYKL